MAKLRGRGLGAGMALGTAAVVRVVSGIPLRPEPPDRIAALIASRRLTETPEIILVADDYRMALAIAPSLSWAKVVGIAAASAETDAPVAPFPVVVDMPGLMSAAQDDVLMLVDATRGVVLADPDPVYLGQYTAEHDRIAPKQRLYLDDSHQPAQTLDGRTISVIAVAENSLENAVESGADALLVSLPLEFDPDIQRRNLYNMVDHAAGKPLLLSYNSFLPLTALIQAAAQIDITLVIPPQAEGDSLGADLETTQSVLAALEQAVSECMEQDLVCAMPRLAAEVICHASKEQTILDEAITKQIEALTEIGVTRLICIASLGTEKNLAQCERVGTVSASHFIPVIFSVSDHKFPGESVAHLIGAGVTGLLAWPQIVPELKETVRGLSYAECWEKLREHLNNTEANA